MTRYSNALLPDDGKLVVMALDHGQLFGRLYDRARDPRPLLEAAVAGGADAVISSFGIFKAHLPVLKGRVKTILRLDGGPSRYLEQWPHYTEWHQLYDVPAAQENGIDAVIVMLFFGGAVEAATSRILASVATEARKVGMPVIAEVIPCPGPTIADPYDPVVIGDAARYCFELGADMVKTTYTGTPESFSAVTKGCPIPVGILGGEHSGSVRELLASVKGSVDGGGAGVFFGRNIWQRSNPVEILQALRQIVHEGSSVDEALTTVQSI